MANTTEALMRALLSVTARQAFEMEKLREIVMTGSAGAKQLRAFNLCDGTRGQAEIAKEVKIDQGNFSRTVGRWIDAGVVFRLGDGRDATLLHVYPLSDAKPKTKERS